MLKIFWKLPVDTIFLVNRFFLTMKYISVLAFVSYGMGIGKKLYTARVIVFLLNKCEILTIKNLFRKSFKENRDF